MSLGEISLTGQPNRRVLSNIMVIRSFAVAVRSRLTRLVVVTTIFLGLTFGSCQIDGQLQAPVPSDGEEENRGPAYLKLMEDSVRALAKSIVDVYPSNCDNLASCDICTPDICRPLDENGNLVCANVSHIARCKEHNPSTSCPSSIRISLERSLVTYPRESLESDPDYVQMRTICGTTGIDATFKHLFKQNPYHADYFVAFPDGSFRIFPGREQSNPKIPHSCTSFDCRRRPWYHAAISHKNHLVILVDSRADPLDPSYMLKSDTLTFAKRFAKELIGTVYDGDRVNVVPFSSAPKANAVLTESVKVGLNMSDAQNHEELEPLKRELDSLRPAPDDVQVTSSNLTAALQEALSLFRSVSGMMMQNVVVFTNGDITYDVGLNTTLDQLAENLVRLFIFSMKNTDDKLRALDALAKRADGAHIRITNSANPMYQLRSYFSYMAALQVRSNRVLPFWTSPYSDYYDIGEFITVVAPGIDVMFLEIDIIGDFRPALLNRPYQEGSIDADIFRSMTVYDDSLTKACDTQRVDNVICKPTKEVDPEEDYLDRFCCSECSGGSSSGVNDILRIAIPTAIFGFLVLVTLSLVAVYCWHRRPSAQRVVEGCSTGQSNKSESGAPQVRNSIRSSQLVSARAKSEEFAKAGGQKSTSDKASGTPGQIHRLSIRFVHSKSPIQRERISAK